MPKLSGPEEGLVFQDLEPRCPKPVVLKLGPWPSGVSVTWELVRKAPCRAPPQPQKLAPCSNRPSRAVRRCMQLAHRWFPHCRTRHVLSEDRGRLTAEKVVREPQVPPARRPVGQPHAAPTGSNRQGGKARKSHPRQSLRGHVPRPPPEDLLRGGPLTQQPAGPGPQRRGPRPRGRERWAGVDQMAHGRLPALPLSRTPVQ